MKQQKKLWVEFGNYKIRLDDQGKVEVVRNKRSQGTSVGREVSWTWERDRKEKYISLQMKGGQKKFREKQLIQLTRLKSKPTEEKTAWHSYGSTVNGSMICLVSTDGKYRIGGNPVLKITENEVKSTKVPDVVIDGVLYEKMSVLHYALLALGLIKRVEDYKPKDGNVKNLKLENWGWRKLC